MSMNIEFTDAKLWHGSEGHMMVLSVPFQTQAKGFMEKMQEGKTYVAEIKEKKPKRSLNANNYSWALTDKLSDVMVIRGVKLSKDEMHAEMIFRYGQVALDDDGQQTDLFHCSKGCIERILPLCKGVCGE